jgi:hypothetical protein
MRTFLFILWILPMSVYGQFRRNQQSSIAAGNIYLSVGMNKTWFSKSTLNIFGAGYNFTLKGFQATDAPSLNLGNLTDVQYNARIGYYFRYGLNISLGFDHLKYRMVSPIQVLLNGRINPGIDSQTGLSGDFANEGVTLDSLFNYNNTALNFINARLSKTSRIVGTRRNDRFLLSSDLGIAAGALVTKSNFIFGGDTDIGVTSLSGIALAGYGALRFEFFEHVFLQTGFNVGVMRQMGVRLREGDPNSQLKQTIAFFEPEIMLGAAFKIKIFNDCNSCPVWK